MWTVLLILGLIWFLLWLCQLGKGGVLIAGAVLLMVILIWIGSIPEKLTAPELEYSVSHSGFLSNSSDATRIQDGTVIVRMSDNKKYYKFSGPSEQIGDKIFIEAKSTARGHEKDDTEIIVSGDVTRSGKNSLVLTNDDFNFGKTKFTATAKNEAGEVTKNFVVEKSSVAEVCQEKGEKYDYDFTKLIEPLETYCKDWYEYEQKKNSSSSGGSNNWLSGSSSSGANGNSSESNSSGSSGNSGKVCAHYEFGRCWDDLEEEAYGNGLWDNRFGTEGDGYNPPDWCTGICEDIYEDAYYEGYMDY